jgi:hypothetical protein
MMKEASRLVKQVSLSSPMTELRSLPNAVSRGVMSTLHQPLSISHNALHALPDEPEEEDLSITWRSDWYVKELHGYLKAQDMINSSGTALSV